MPFKGFITPVVIDGEAFHESTLSGGLLIDRPKLYRSLKNISTGNESLKSEIISWCKEKAILMSN